jgi:hypothetical protein
MLDINEIKKFEQSALKLQSKEIEQHQHIWMNSGLFIQGIYYKICLKCRKLERT